MNIEMSLIGTAEMQPLPR